MNLYDGNLALFVMFGIVVYIALASLWWLRREPLPAALGAMLARQGIDWARLAAAGAMHDFTLGVRRCNDCHARAQCREWLARGRREGYETFCPSAGFIERMKRFAVR